MTVQYFVLQEGRGCVCERERRSARALPGCESEEGRAEGMEGRGYVGLGFVLLSPPFLKWGKGLRSGAFSRKVSRRRALESDVCVTLGGIYLW